MQKNHFILLPLEKSQIWAAKAQDYPFWDIWDVQKKFNIHCLKSNFKILKESFTEVCLLKFTHKTRLI